MSCCGSLWNLTTEKRLGLPSTIICLPSTGTIGIEVPGHLVFVPFKISKPLVLHEYTVGFLIMRVRPSFFNSFVSYSIHQYSATLTTSVPIHPSLSRPA